MEFCVYLGAVSEFFVLETLEMVTNDVFFMYKNIFYPSV
jgi:hypothetical protein